MTDLLTSPAIWILAGLAVLSWAMSSEGEKTAKAKAAKAEVNREVNGQRRLISFLQDSGHLYRASYDGRTATVCPRDPDRPIDPTLALTLIGRITGWDARWTRLRQVGVQWIAIYEPPAGEEDAGEMAA